MSMISRTVVSRRDALRIAGLSGAALLSAPAFAACSSSDAPAVSDANAPAKSLSVLCWEGYTNDTLVESFREKYGTEIKSTFIASNDELISQLTNGSSNFDLISPSIDTTQTLIEAGLVQPIDAATIPSLKTTYAKFKDAGAIQSDGKSYGVPIGWGMIPLLYNRGKVGRDLDSWSSLWDEQFADKISVWDDISTIYVTGLVLGFDNLYDMSDDQLNAVQAKLLEQKPLLKKYWATLGELTNLFAAGEIFVANSGGGLSYTQLKKQGLDVVEVVPKEGATAWVDYWMIPAKSANPNTAQLWMDWTQTPENQAVLSKATGFAPTNSATADLVDPEFATQFSLKNPATFDRLIFWEKVPNRQKYLDVLTAVKAA